MTFLLERNAILHYIDHHSHVLLTSSDQVLICHGCTPKHENSKNIYIYLAGLCVFIIIRFFNVLTSFFWLDLPWTRQITNYIEEHHNMNGLDIVLKLKNITHYLKVSL